MLSSDSSSICGRIEVLRDYAFDELPPDEGREMEQHLADCPDCVLELDRLRLTTAALRTLPDREIPQRIAFVSDRVFEPSRLSRFWTSASRLGFASACVLSLAIIMAAFHRPAEVRTIVQTASVPQKQIDAAVTKAVAQVKAEDARMIQAAIQAAEQKHDQAYRNQMVAIEENYSVLQKRLNSSYRMLAANDVAGPEAGR